LLPQQITQFVIKPSGSLEIRQELLKVFHPSLLAAENGSGPDPPPVGRPNNKPRKTGPIGLQLEALTKMGR
jgi:hypothetical protein